METYWNWTREQFLPISKRTIQSRGLKRWGNRWSHVISFNRLSSSRNIMCLRWKTSNCGLKRCFEPLKLFGTKKCGCTMHIFHSMNWRLLVTAEVSCESPYFSLDSTTCSNQRKGTNFPGVTKNRKELQYRSTPHTIPLGMNSRAMKRHKQQWCLKRPGKTTLLAYCYYC